MSYKGVVTEGLEAILGDMRAGGTLVLDQLHHREPKLGLLCRVLAAELGHRFQTNLYLTPSNGKGFTPHWDNHDVFILQVVGSKNWNIEKQRRALPGKGDTINDEERELRGASTLLSLNKATSSTYPAALSTRPNAGRNPRFTLRLV